MEEAEEQEARPDEEAGETGDGGTTRRSMQATSAGAAEQKPTKPALRLSQPHKSEPSSVPSQQNQSAIERLKQFKLSLMEYAYEEACNDKSGGLGSRGPRLACGLDRRWLCIGRIPEVGQPQSRHDVHRLQFLEQQFARVRHSEHGHFVELLA